MAFKKLFTAARRKREPAIAAPSAPLVFPLEEEQRLYGAHGRVAVERHLEIVLGDYMIGDRRFVDLYRQAMEDTGTVVTPFNVFQRYETRRHLCRYWFATPCVRGLRAECGVYRGATALLLCRAQAILQPGYDGEGMFLIDSFSGTSRSVAEDLIPVRAEDGSVRLSEFFPEGRTDTSAEMVRRFFEREFARARIHAGWIPEIFATLPDSAWAYVHLDVSLYEPTLAALEYFHPRLSPGGMILCDGSIFCPGAEAAFREYCERKGLAYVLLSHREYVLSNDAV